MTPQLQIVDSLLAGASKAAERTIHYFLRTQYDQGYWWAELTADTTLGSFAAANTLTITVTQP